MSAFHRLLDKHRVVVVSGAGLSTASGIPDYRGEGTRARARNPMRFHEFVGTESARRRYWARAALGWPPVRDAMPNAGHVAVAALQNQQTVCGVITQNVDRLHHKAGSVDAVELHGALAEVVCIDCHSRFDRNDVQRRIAALNPHHGVTSAELHADGDASIDEDALAAFVVPACTLCSGRLKPRVVFFGDNVEKPVLASAWDAFNRGSALVVLGSSLEVFSGRRFVDEAHRRRWPIVIVNRGATRSDEKATLKVEADLSEVLQNWVACHAVAR
jgi:NAD+-dependent protein deacetylase sirtuin 4